MKSFDIAPFALPNCAPGEIRFEEPRDIIQVTAIFKGAVPDDVGLSYLRRRWPEMRQENLPDNDDPCSFGWVPQDDWFNQEWHKAKVNVRKDGKNRLCITFPGLKGEFSDLADYDVAYRRTLGIRVDTANADSVKDFEIYTTSSPLSTKLRVELDAGMRTPTKRIVLYGYNIEIDKIKPIAGISVDKGLITSMTGKKRSFEFLVFHMNPVHRYCNDEGLVTFSMDSEAFTISLESLGEKGPIWFADRGVYIALADDPTDFAAYRKKIEGAKTINELVKERPDHKFIDAYLGQPRPHAVSSNVGCKYNRHRFWIEANGDILLVKGNACRVHGKDTERFKSAEGPGCHWGGTRFYYGLENWNPIGNYSDPAPVISFNANFKRDTVLVEQKSFAVPLLKSVSDPELAGDDTCVAMVRFRFRNLGVEPAVAELPIRFSEDAGRSYPSSRPFPVAKFEDLLVKGDRLETVSNGRKILRATLSTTMKCVRGDSRVTLKQRLAPGESCDLFMKIPFIALDTKEELDALASLDFDKDFAAVVRFWHEEGKKGAQLTTPDTPLNTLHRAHLSHVLVTDFKMPNDPWLINTSVGTSTYGNFSNESCMITQEIDQRGLHEDAQRRLELWIEYQGTAIQPGNFTDHYGMYFGAGGFEEGAYNQHHGWVLWCLCEHFFLSGDEKWFQKVADSVIAGADWVFRQRRNTMTQLPHSRGWEYGFLPAGSLEDVTDFFYWLSTNSLTWRGTEWVARALESIDHPEASRMREEADAYREDLICGFETMRQHSPLIRLRNGRWVPQYPSRLYRRGRDMGWIRQLLEGAVYLMISGLYDPNSESGQWILDDYQDNLYIKPPYGYLIPNLEANWYCRGGFSIQPNLLAGLLPHLDRDEPEIFIWMFYNAWVSCYREDIDALIEHPAPVLGYSNSAHYKTSDEGNAIMWLRYMVVYALGDLLHYGRAIPRYWFEDGKTVELAKVATYFGETSVRYESNVKKGAITATVKLPPRKTPGKVLVRFRHPDKLEIQSVKVNGKKHSAFDSPKGDVDITGMKGKVVVEARF